MATVFAPYSSESKATAVRSTLVYTDTTAKSLFTLPAGAVILEWILNVTTAFNANTTNVVDIGISGTAQKFVANLDVTTTGLKSSGVVAAQIGAVQTTDQAIIAVYTPTSSTVTTGAITIICRYYFP